MTVDGGRPITLHKHKNICADVIIMYLRNNIEQTQQKKTCGQQSSASAINQIVSLYTIYLKLNR